MEDTNKSKIIVGIILGIIAIVVIVLLCLKGCTKEFTVSFDSNGGTEVSSITVKENESIEKPANPKKDGYTFAGWYYYDELFDFDTKIKEDITLVAKWVDGDNRLVLASTNINLLENGQEEIEVLSYPEDLTINDLVFISSDESIVKVDSNGKLTALKSGTVVITVKSEDGKYEEKVTVTVNQKQEEQPSTNNQEVPKTNNTGTSKKPTGNTSSSTKPSGNSGESSNTKPSTPAKPTEVLADGVTITGGNSVDVGSQLHLTANVTPSNATDKSVTWSIVSGSDKATIDQNGNLTAKASGKVVVQVKTTNGKIATKEITINSVKPVYSIVMIPECIEVDGMAPQRYTFKVYKDGTKTTDYNKFIYNGVEATPRSYSIVTEAINREIKSVSIQTSTGNYIATVTYEEIKKC